MEFTHVLITRPEEQAARLAERLAGSGLEAVIMPAYGFELAHPGFEFAGAWQRAGRRLAIFTSTRAVEFGLRQLPAGFLDDASLAAIGPATANALAEVGHGVSLLPEGSFDSEALLAHPALSEEPGDAIIFAAPGGRTRLMHGLEGLGWKVRMAFVYRRVPREPSNSQLESLAQAGAVISVWTSANAMELLSRALPDETWKRICRGVCVVTSKRLRRKIEKLGATATRVTDGPGNDAISRLVLHLT